MGIINLKTDKTRSDCMAVSKELLDILRCPKCQGKLNLNDEGNGLICESCRLMYEIKDGIPVMLVDEAKKI
jgi:uncharacterized protein